MTKRLASANYEPKEGSIVVVESAALRDRYMVAKIKSVTPQTVVLNYWNRSRNDWHDADKRRSKDGIIGEMIRVETETLEDNIRAIDEGINRARKEMEESIKVANRLFMDVVYNSTEDVS